LSASIVAVERGSRVFVEFPPEFKIEPEDLVYVCGTRPSLAKYQNEFDTAAVERVVAEATAL